MRGKSPKAFRGKRVLVTGGTGSIGRQITCELLKNDVGVVRVFDMDEGRESRMQEELREYPNVRFLLGDIRDRDRLLRAMEEIDVVFHTASFKHVLACEYNPFEAVKTNVIGTQNLIDAALNEEVDKLIFTSSDKAVNPSNVMGTTKLLAERLVTAANYYRGPRKTVFSSVRFGNVLGSSGSVVHLFKKQIRDGGPLTVTDPSMTRFMMSISQAVDLLFEATEAAQGGEVFIFKMPSVKILDLAQVMIDELSQACARKAADYEIKEIGKKPGEKLYEELMTQTEAAHSIEMKDMFCVLPEIMKDLGINIGHYPDSKRARVKSYTSNDSKFLSKKEIRELLCKCDVLSRR